MEAGLHITSGDAGALPSPSFLSEGEWRALKKGGPPAVCGRAAEKLSGALLDVAAWAYATSPCDARRLLSTQHPSKNKHIGDFWHCPVTAWENSVEPVLAAANKVGWDGADRIGLRRWVPVASTAQPRRMEDGSRRVLVTDFQIQIGSKGYAPKAALGLPLSPPYTFPGPLKEARRKALAALGAPPDIPLRHKEWKGHHLRPYPEEKTSLMEDRVSWSATQSDRTTARLWLALADVRRASGVALRSSTIQPWMEVAFGRPPIDTLIVAVNRVNERTELTAELGYRQELRLGNNVYSRPLLVPEADSRGISSRRIPDVEDYIRKL